ncbi:6857_t:CDS:2, partial [Scutellospora calospora]
SNEAFASQAQNSYSDSSQKSHDKLHVKQILESQSIYVQLLIEELRIEPLVEDTVKVVNSRTHVTESTLKSRFNPSDNKNHMTKPSSLRDVSNIKASISAKSFHAPSSEDIISEDNKSSSNTNNNNYILQDNILLETNPNDSTEVSELSEKVSSETE